MTHSYPNRRRPDPQEQHTRLMMFFPDWRRVRRANPIIWEGTLRPIGGALYTIQIEYRYGSGYRPLVRVLRPQLQPREDGGRVPHTFKTGEICLHMVAEWTSTMYIHETIIPWSVLWLYYYEMWLATGLWLGGGHEPADNEGPQELEASNP
jgi:hypothetical protein